MPTIGDRTSAAERQSDPAGWAFPVADQDALARVMGARRDIRRFRPDPVPDPYLRDLLVAAHAAPSVGHSQPWRLVVVRNPDTRARAAVMADRARLEQATAMDSESARHLLDLDLEGIREAPLGIVVCCDRRTPAPGVLGRATFPDADMWSCACAIQNLWLAARARGLGVGWVTLFQPEDLAGLVGAPAGVATLGWLCVGWPDERPPGPGLERRGWSVRQSVGDVVLYEGWPREGAPASPPSHLAPQPPAVVRAHDTGDRLLSPPGSLGVLDRALDRVLAVRPEGVPARPGHLFLVAADHPVTAHGVSAYLPGVTRTVAEASAAGVSIGAVAAARSGLDLTVVDAGVEGPAVAGALSMRPVDRRGDLVDADALSGRDVDALLGQGAALVAGLSPAPPLVALGEIGVGNTTVAAAMAAGMLGLDPAAVVGLGSGSDSAVMAAKRAVVAAAVARAGPRAREPRGALAALGGGEIAVLAGAVLGAATAGSVVVLDGLATGVAALVAVALDPAVAAHLVAGQRSREVGHPFVLAALGLEPLLDLRLRAGEGVGAALAVQLLSAASAIRLGSARTGPS